MSAPRVARIGDLERCEECGYSYPAAKAGEHRAGMNHAASALSCRLRDDGFVRVGTRGPDASIHALLHRWGRLKFEPTRTAASTRGRVHFVRVRWASAWSVGLASQLLTYGDRRGGTTPIKPLDLDVLAALKGSVDDMAEALEVVYRLGGGGYLRSMAEMLLDEAERRS